MPKMASGRRLRPGSAGRGKLCSSKPLTAHESLSRIDGCCWFSPTLFCILIRDSRVSDPMLSTSQPQCKLHYQTGKHVKMLGFRTVYSSINSPLKCWWLVLIWCERKTLLLLLAEQSESQSMAVESRAAINPSSFS